MGNSKNNNQTNDGIDFFDFLILLWKNKYQFLITFSVIFLLLYSLIQIFRLNYNEIQSDHYINNNPNKEYSYLLLNKDISEVISILPKELSTNEFMNKLNIEFDARLEYYYNEISKDLSLYNLNPKLTDVIISLVQVGFYTDDKNTNSIKISNVSRYYDSLENIDVSKIKKVINNHYSTLVANTQNSFVLGMSNEVKSFEELVEDIIIGKTTQYNIALETQSEIDDSYVTISKYVDQDFFWDNIVDLKTSADDSAEVLQKLQLEIRALVEFKSKIGEIISNRYTGYAPLDFKSKVSVSSPLTSNNYILFSLSILLSLIATILIIYSYNRLKLKIESA